LILPDEAPLTPEGELQLPCDLAALGEQLGDDARYLARQYPAGAEPRVKPRLASNYRRLAKAAALVGSTLATLLVAVLVVQQLGPARHSAAPPADTAPLAAKPIAAKPIATVPTAATPAGPSRLVVPAGGATISLTELSAPELEAVFDLWRQDAGKPASIAF
jgi:hypothetical protein